MKRSSRSNRFRWFLGVCFLLAWAKADPGQADKMFLALSSNLQDAKNFTDALAMGIVTAPNGKVKMGEANDWSPEELKKKRVTRQLRLEAGDPKVSFSVWIIGPPPEKAKATVFVLPGITASKESMRGWGLRLAGAGYRCVLPDLRGQGRSNGAYMTYGARESRDLTAILDILLERKLVAEPVFSCGLSYGAACSVCFAGNDARVKAVAARSCYASLNRVVVNYARLFFPMMESVFTPQLLAQAVKRSGEIANFDVDDASPSLAAAKTKASILLLHGTVDVNIPISHAEEIRRVDPERITLFPIKGASHDRNFKGRDTRKMIEFFNQVCEKNKTNVSVK